MHAGSTAIEAGGLKYWAFLSYSREDEAFAASLHRELERYRVPREVTETASPDNPVPGRIHPIFRDQDELPASSDLGGRLRLGLQQSRTMIVVCSPHAAASTWVNEEVMEFARLGRADRILAVIVDGEPNCSTAASPAERECLPAALRHAARESTAARPTAEPLAADARGVGKGWAARRARHDVILRLVAGILRIGFDDLKRRDQARRRRRRYAGGATLGLVLAAVMVAGWWYVRDRRALQEAQNQIAAAQELDRRSLQEAKERIAAVQELDRRRINDEDVFLGAASDGDSKTVHLFLQAGFDVNARDREGNTVLILAARQAPAALLEVLLDRGADVNAENTAGFSALNWAAGGGRLENIETLLKRGANRESIGEALQSASNAAVMRLLLARGADLREHGAAALVSAVFGGRKDCVELLLQNGVDVDATDDKGRTALMASLSGNGTREAEQLAVADLLLARSASVNVLDADGCSALGYAVQSHGGAVRLVPELLARGADVNVRCRRGRVEGWTPLMLAAALQHPDAMRVLIANGADVNASDANGETALVLAASVRDGGEALVRLMIEKGADPKPATKYDDTALTMLAFRCALTVEAVKALRDHGADIDARRGDGSTALMLAAERCEPEVVAALLEAGAEVDLADESGNTALFLASGEGRAEIVRILLAAGAELKGNALGYTPLVHAATDGNAETLQVLLAGGAPVDEPDSDGRTALSFAAEAADTDRVRVLLAAGANPDATDEFDQSVLDRARNGGNPVVVELIKSAGTKH